MLKKAFTLIEILVVVTIIAMILALGIVSYSTTSRQGRDTKRKADLEQIRAALEMYRSNDPNSAYPASATCGGLTASLTPNYISKIPIDPTSTYSYYCNVTITGYSLGAYLEGAPTACPGPISCVGANCSYSVGPYGQTCP